MTKIDAMAPFAFDGLDRVMHEKARLGLLSSLVAHPKGLAFSDLKQLCGLTDGNLNRHLQVLQEAGLVEIQKILKDVEGIHVVRFDEEDVVRHPLVKKIIRAFDRWDKEKEKNGG